MAEFKLLSSKRNTRSLTKFVRFQESSKSQEESGKSQEESSKSQERCSKDVAKMWVDSFLTLGNGQTFSNSASFVSKQLKLCQF